MTSLTAILDVLGHDDDQFPVSRLLMPLEALMRKLGYTSAARREVLAHVARTGSVHGCETIECDPEACEDLDVLEAFVVGVNPIHWPEWTDSRVSLTA